MKKLEEEHKKKDKNTHIKNIGEKYFETIRKKTSLWQEYTYDGKQEAIKKTPQFSKNVVKPCSKI